MTPAERANLIDQLRQAPAILRADLAGLADGQARYRPEPGRWSILDCVEHVALAETLMFELIVGRSAPAGPGQGREDRFLAGSTNRTRKIAAPDGTRPADRFPTLTAAFDAFVERRNRTIRCIEESPDDLRRRRIVHPVAGEITCRECLALMIGHPLRHADQIREIKRSPGFPES